MPFRKTLQPFRDECFPAFAPAGWGHEGGLTLHFIFLEGIAQRNRGRASQRAEKLFEGLVLGEAELRSHKGLKCAENVSALREVGKMLWHPLRSHDFPYWRSCQRC